MADIKFSQFTNTPTPNANAYFVGYNSVTGINSRTTLTDLITAIGAPSGTGTTNFVTKWSGTNSLGDSLFYSDANIAKTIYSGADKGLKLDFANNLSQLANNNEIGILSVAYSTYIGDINEINNSTNLIVDDANQIIKTNNVADKGLFLDFAANQYSFGDYDGAINGTTLIVNDATQVINLFSQRVGYSGQDSATIAAFTGNTAGQLAFNSDSNSFQFYNGSAWVGFGGTVTGTGTTNYVTKWSSTSGVGASTLLYDGGTFIGVNRTTSAGFLFDINGTFRVANSTYLATTSGGAVGIGLTSIDSSAQLHMSSTTKGLLMPRLTTTQMNAIGTPANGLMIYNTTTSQLYVYSGGVWTALASGGGSGTVTSITAGTGLSGGTITTSGTISLANTAVVAGAYTSANITIDAQGRITSAANGSGGGGYSAITQSLTGNRILINAPTDDTSSILQVNGVARATRFITNSGSVYIDNVLIGRDAGLNFGTVNYSTAVGSGSQEFNTSGNQNTSVGYQSLRSCTTGVQNTAIGSDTLKASTTLSYNTAIGALAMQSHTSGTQNTVIGYRAKFSGASGTNNCVLGAYAFELGTGTGCIAIGVQSLGNNSTNPSGNNNIAIGGQSLYRISTGSNNIGIGPSSGYTGTNDLTTGSNNILIGLNSNTESATESDRTFIGNTLTTSTWLGGSLLIGTRTNDITSVATFASTTKGVLLPRMTTAEINAIVTPTNGLMAYNTTLNKLCIFENGTWQQVTTTAM